MREISNKEYAERIEDSIAQSICDGIERAYDFLAREYGFEPDFYKRETNGIAVCEELWLNGEMARFRDAVIEQFERHGMNITGDGRDF